MFYSLAWILVLPFAFLHLLWRARKQPEYLQHWPQRLGWIQDIDVSGFMPSRLAKRELLRR
jgi:3-deoxy-D-manno-octulosonic-acid transferase